MPTRDDLEHLSDCPQVAHLRLADRLQTTLLAAIAIVTGIILTGWLAPGFGADLPYGWSRMDANTALALLLCALGVSFTQRPRNPYATAITVGSGIAVALFGLSALLGHLAPRPIEFDTLLATDAVAPLPGPMSISTALFLFTAGLAIATGPVKGRGRLQLADVFATLMLAQALVVVGGNLYGASTPGVGTEAGLTPPHTLVSIVMVTTAVLVRHLRSGMYSLIVGMGIGSAFLRIGLPWMFVLPYLIVLCALGAVDRVDLDTRLAAALAAAFSALLTLLFSLGVARRLNALEAELRSQSLTDPLTGLHNRRGFEVLGEQRFHEAARDREKVGLLYFDLDGLKQVNDRHGHEIGSRMIQDFARLLTDNFRHSDVLGRIGGDEFAVLLRDGDDAEVCIKRLADVTALANAVRRDVYCIQYSVGIEYASPDLGDTLTDLVNRADQSMYHHKRAKREHAVGLGEMASLG